MNKSPKRSERIRREIFVLTAEEKRTICFVLAAFLLGLVTKLYRDAHPVRMLKVEPKVHGQASPHQ